ncbi:hypothetical protein [Nocardioides sp. Kera G14]|uniref:hypothetical protein n=1 Tax=Nocardioides sp. Kera G14 TaxID=2884264 RepID=UPI001D1255CA|nr:hypothetical protein [Nocardioides sp. Kera G14]UDY24503.1 hypothetical protein LH076_04150 [Nocardioides sp. Kera G14]
MSHWLDAGVRGFWRVAGRAVNLAGDDSWLAAPTSLSPRVADSWLDAEAERLGGRLEHNSVGGGLLPSMAMLDGPGFSAAALRPEIRDFYEHTADWRLEVWSAWSPLFWPGGELISRLYGRRVEQLALPMRPLDVAHGMDSRVTLISDAAGAQVGAAWERMLRGSGRHVFSGCYSARRLPGSDHMSVHVAFPLEAGNVQVFLRPSVTAEGALLLESPSGRFGEDGAYVVVEERGSAHAVRVPLHETFHVYVDPAGVLRTDHELRLRGRWVTRLHYRLERREA